MDPQAVPGCKLWLDASDSTTLTSAQPPTISIWTDKINKLPFKGSTYPTATRNSVHFSKIASFSNNTVNIFPPYTLFIVQNSIDTNQFLKTGETTLLKSTPINTWCIQKLVVTDTAALSINGSQQLTSGAIEIQGLTLGGDGFVSELLIYGSELTQQQQDLVEGYLAWKYTIATSRPPAFFPGNLTTQNTAMFSSYCLFWFDAADQTTMEGKALSSWKSKGSFTGVIKSILPPSPKRTTGIQFISGSEIGLYAPISCMLPPYGILFLVFQATKGSLFRLNSHTNGSNLFIDLDVETPRWMIGEQTPQLNSIKQAGTQILTVIMDMTGQTIYRNGILIQSVPAPTDGTKLYSVTELTLGASLEGTIYEAIFLSGLFKESQQRTIEAYLGKKWSISVPTMLPVIHPYYTITPPLYTYTPCDPGGCVLWLDGADTSTSSMSLNGTTMIAWYDKSNNLNHFIGGPPDLPIVANGVDFPLKASLTCINPFQCTSSWSVFIVAKLDLNAPHHACLIRFVTTQDYSLKYLTKVGNWYEADVTDMFYKQDYYVNGIRDGGASFFQGYVMIYGTMNNPPKAMLTLSKNFTGSIAEVAIYNHPLTVSQRKQMETYITKKWML